MSATPASDLLRSEHRLVEAQIDRLLAAVKQPGDVAIEVRQALSAIQLLLQLHFEKEEGVVYPYLRPQFPELLSQLDEQHEYEREVERHLVELLESIQGAPDKRQREEVVRFGTELYDVIQHHIVDEEDQLLRLADSRLSPEEQADLAGRMMDLDRVPDEACSEHRGIEK